jgi:hypothetical protein
LKQIKARPARPTSIASHDACRGAMSAGALTPASTAAALAVAGAPACAGLRRDLLHQWQRGFPIEHSPFQVVARRAGGTLREVLGHCQALNQAGALDMIRVHWSARLARVRWRCCQSRRRDARLAIEATLRALPGVTRLTQVMPASAGDSPALWFDMAARDAQAAAAQRARFEARHGPVEVIDLAGSNPAEGCGCHEGPCREPELAGRCEAGLPLVAHPFEVLAAERHASEREVLGSLRRWQRCGALQSLALAPPQGVHEHCGAVAWVEATGDETALHALAVRLRGASGIDEVDLLPAGAERPWRLMAAAPGAPRQASRLLERALDHASAEVRVHRIVPVRHTQLRREPLLFARLEG